jgi:hypothetical protein
MIDPEEYTPKPLFSANSLIPELFLKHLERSESDKAQSTNNQQHANLITWCALFN